MDDFGIKYNLILYAPISMSGTQERGIHGEAHKPLSSLFAVTPRILELNFFFSSLAKFGCYPFFFFLFPR
jgi:hypothetical protein